MKIFIDLEKEKIIKTDDENRTIYRGDENADAVKVYFKELPTNWYLTLGALLANGRKIDPRLHDGPILQEEIDGINYYSYKFTLSKANGFLLVNGIINFTLWINYTNDANKLTKQKAVGTFVINVANTTEIDNNIIITGDDSGVVIENFKTSIESTQALVSILENRFGNYSMSDGYLFSGDDQMIANKDDYGSPSNVFGNVDNPTLIQGAGYRPKYSNGDGFIFKEIALLDDVRYCADVYVDDGVLITPSNFSIFTDALRVRLIFTEIGSDDTTYEYLKLTIHDSSPNHGEDAVTYWYYTFENANYKLDVNMTDSDSIFLYSKEIRGVYDNLSALKSAYPNGASGRYITSDNGHWYYWKAGVVWEDGGIYQSIDIPNIYGVSLTTDDNGIISLHGRDGKILSQIDLPTEKIITNIRYNEEIESLIFSFVNNPDIIVPIGDIFELDNYYTKEEIEEQYYTKKQNDSSLNNLKQELNNKISQVESGLNQTIDEVETSVDNLEKLIPIQANVNNQLADKNFVNSSISTNTATFQGTYSSISEFPSYNVDNNDYVFLKVIDEITGLVKQYDRYKYNDKTGIWVYEYTLNNSSFTSNQWEAINSGITTSLIENILQDIDNNKQNINTLKDYVDTSFATTDEMTTMLEEVFS